MKLPSFFLGAALTALLLGGGTAIAQQGNEACDAIEPEEGKGSIQGIVWATTVRTDPNRSDKSLELPILYFDGKGWKCVVAVEPRPQGKWLDAQPGDGWLPRLEKNG